MSVIQTSEFTKKVLQKIHQIPAGKVATYKQIAGLAGKPQGSRGVAWILHSCATTYKLPWHRVINAQGRIAFDPKSHNFVKQRKLLSNEGVAVAADGRLDLKKYQWKKAPPQSKKARPRMFQG